MLDRLRQAAFGHGLPDTRSLLETLDAIRNADVRREIERIVAPTFIVSGAEDPIVAPGAAEWLTARIPGAILASITGAGHVPFLSHPEEILPRLQRFVYEASRSV